MWRLGLIGILLLTSLAQAQTELPSNPRPTDRPRLLLTQSYIEEVLKPRMAAETPAWQTLFAYGQNADTASRPAEVARTLAALYLLTGEQSYANRAQVSLLLMVDQLESHAAMTQNAPWDEDFLDAVAGTALAFDWLYPALNANDRKALVNVLLRAVAILNEPIRGADLAYIASGEDSFRFASYDHWGAKLIWALAATGIALLGEDPSAPDILAYARTLFTGWMIPTLDQLAGGAWAEGLTYGWEASWANLQTASAFWTALGEDYLSNTRWWYDRLAYNLFSRYPSLQHVGNDPQNPLIWGYPAIIGDSARYSEAAYDGRAQDLLLTALFAGTEHAGWMNWFLTQKSEPALQNWMAVEEFLWRDESATDTFPPPWRIWFTGGAGHVFLRSDWNLDNDSTYLSFNVGDHYAAHQFFDQGNITLVRGDDELLVRSGVYSGQSDSDANYTGRSIAANVPLICDLSESFQQIRPNPEQERWLNDCGQRATLTYTAINPFFFAENRQAYETGTILRFSEEGSFHYFRADLTPAYNSIRHTTPPNRAKVNEVLREFLYIRPNHLIIHDRIQVTDASLAVLNRFHLPSVGSIDGAWVSIEVGDSALLMQEVTAQKTARFAEAYQVEGETLIPQGNAFEPNLYQSYPVEWLSSDPHFFLTVIVVGAAETLQAPETQFIRGEGMYGLRVDDWQIMFDDDPQNISQARFEVQNQVSTLILTGLTPLGSYRAELPNGETANLQADEAGTLLILNTVGGEIRLRSR